MTVSMSFFFKDKHTNTKLNALLISHSPESAQNSRHEIECCICNFFLSIEHKMTRALSGHMTWVFQRMLHFLPWSSQWQILRTGNVFLLIDIYYQFWVRFEVLIVVNIKILVFWVVAPCSFVGRSPNISEEPAASVFRVHFSSPLSFFQVLSSAPSVHRNSPFS
jgi:hypothetical protein